MTLEAMFIALGMAGIGIGLLVANRLRKWRPHSSAMLTEYDPGPDFFDWLQAAAFVTAGVALMALATMV